jgi:integrase
MRRGEAIGLRWSEVDMEHGSLRVVRALVPVNGKVIVSQPKTARGRRTIGLDATARVALERQAAQQVNDQVVAGSAYTDNGLVFANEIGGALDPDAVSRAFEEAVSGAPVPHLTLHGLRHSHISIGIAAGESLLVMSRRAGHSREAITADVYGHLAPDLDGAAATRISALVFGDPEQGA